MWTSGDPLVLFPWLLGTAPPSSSQFFLVQQPLQAVGCFSSLFTCINQETICHQHSGSVGVNKPQEPKGETQMTQPCPSNHGEKVILGGFCIYEHCDHEGLFTCVYESRKTCLFTCEVEINEAMLSFFCTISDLIRWCLMQAPPGPPIHSLIWSLSCNQCMHEVLC